VHAQPALSGMPVLLRNLVASCLAKAAGDRPLLAQLLDAVMAESAFCSGASPSNYWPEPVAGLIGLRRDSFRTQVAARAENGPVAIMWSVPHEATTPAWAGSNQDDAEATQTAAGVPSDRADPLIDRPGPLARKSIPVEPESAPTAGTSTITRVPRTDTEQQQLLAERPIGWEFLYFAARLLYERNSVDGKYRDYLMSYAPPTGEVVGRLDARAHMEAAVDDSVRLVVDLERIMSDSAAKERAFGPALPRWRP